MYCKYCIQSQNAVVPLIVVKGTGPSLFGRNWLTHIRLEWQEINYVPVDAVQPVLDKYPSVFQEGLGKLQGFKAKIHVDPNAEPRFFRPKTMPYAVRDKVEKELARLQEEGTIEAVEVSDWAAPIVPVVKSDKSTVRICGDFELQSTQYQSWTRTHYQEWKTSLQNWKEDRSSQSLT